MAKCPMPYARSHDLFGCHTLSSHEKTLRGRSQPHLQPRGMLFPHPARKQSCPHCLQRLLGNSRHISKTRSRAKNAMTIKKVPDAFFTYCSRRIMSCVRAAGSLLCSEDRVVRVQPNKLSPKSVSGQAGLRAIGKPDDRSHQA